MKQQNKENKSVLVQAKVSRSVAHRLETICTLYGFSSKYELLQYLISAFLRFADEGAPATADEERTLSELSRLFIGWKNPKTRHNLCAPVTASASTVCFLTDGTLRYFTRRGEAWTSTLNHKKAFDALLSQLFPSVSKELTYLAKESGKAYAIDALLNLLEQQDPLHEEIAAGFSILALDPKQDRSKGKPVTRRIPKGKRLDEQ